MKLEKENGKKEVNEMNINGKHVYLRAMEPEDMELYRDMINDESISKMVIGWSYPVSKHEQMNWYERAIKNTSVKRFTICTKEDDTAVGMVTFSNIDFVNRCAFHGIKLHSSCPKGEGIGTDALMASMRFAFDELNLNRLEGEWFLYNTASKRLYEKCGWREEGIKRKSIFRNGKYCDVAISGILKEEYEKVSKTFEW